MTEIIAPTPETAFRDLLEKIYKEKGFDFRAYKETTLKRRIERRFQASAAASYKDYIIALEANPQEYEKLIAVLLINVTEFFRDKEAFDIVRDRVLPDMVERGCGVKIWSAGCATGEEVYSMAILLNEILGDKIDDFPFSIYGTDIDKHSLEKAKEAVYPVRNFSNGADGLLNKYFVVNGTLRVKESVKRNCHFMLHDLVLDKPLNEIDLIACRNVAIYFERPLQEKIYMDFYNALKEGGFLFLGKAETLIGPARERFEVIDKRWRIYKKGRM